MPSDDADYVAVVKAWNEAITQAQKGKPIPTATIYVLAIQKHLSNILYPQHRCRWAHKIGDPEKSGKDSRDAPTQEERRRMMKQQQK